MGRSIRAAALATTAALMAWPAATYADPGDIYVSQFDPPNVIEVAAGSNARSSVVEDVDATPMGIEDTGGALLLSISAPGLAAVVPGALDAPFSTNDEPSGYPEWATPMGITAIPVSQGLPELHVVADAGLPGQDGYLVLVGPDGERTMLSRAGAVGDGPSLGKVQDVAYSNLDHNLYVTSRGEDGEGAVVFKVDSDSGDRQILSTNGFPTEEPQMFTPSGVLVEPDGSSILVADQGDDGEGLDGTPGRILQIDVQSGDRIVRSQNSNPTEGPAFVSPTDLDLDPRGNVVIADSEAFADFNGGLIRIPAGGAQRTAIASNETPSATAFTGPFGVTVEQPVATCSGAEATITGTGAADTIRGTTGDDVIDTRGGDDVVKGLGGDDQICGAAGSDTIAGNGGQDVVYGGSGADDCRGGAADQVRRCE